MNDLFIPFSNGYSTKIVSSTYKPYLSKEFIEYWVSSKYPTSFNGSAVRLEGIEIDENSSTILSLSELNFYSFLTSNLLIEGVEVSSKNLENYLTCPYLANILAVSVLVYDSGSVLLAERSSEVALNPCKYGVSVTGGLTSKDLSSEDCLVSAIRSEVKEELGILIEKKNIEISGLYISKDKLQPVIICFIRVKDLKDLSLSGSDTDFEVHSWHITPRNSISSLGLDSSNTAEFHLNYFMESYKSVENIRNQVLEGD